MTLYHFGNCVALIYVPYYYTYKHSGLSEYGAFWKCIQAGLIYMITQLAKMLILATFFPENVSDLGNDVVGEFLKSTVDLADLAGLYLVLSGIPGKGHSKVLTAGIGWATAEVILSRALLLWVGARGAEFDWIYIQKCIESNILLIQHIVTATLVWLWSRHDLKHTIRSTIVVLLFLTAYKGFLLDLLVAGLGANAWVGLLIKASVTITYGLFTLIIYAELAQVIGIF
ncbi:transmembrane protein 147 [Diabrotica virgifera virgifera]|uniref:BOS complex subunit TMEM147 n=1 Tax=Diabrotica virgifera virgifera TaxID=50390 RepID=A0ABM5L084_DIAVI|nr:transmembrane protein 147 [Diabrotica virgifera virgifera]